VRVRRNKENYIKAPLLRIDQIMLLGFFDGFFLIPKYNHGYVLSDRREDLRNYSIRKEPSI